MAKSEETSGDDSSRPWQSYHTVYTSAKAGMEGVDKEKVQRVVYEMSKGSKYFENEERKEAYMKQKIENMRAQCAKLTAADISHYQKVADRRILELEATRDLSRIWLHVDMDAFYATVETLSNPSLKGKPMAVGSMSMISTANYEARKFGVRAAMPGFIACKLCPELIFVPTDFKKYTYYSDLTRKVFQKYDVNFMAASLDEAYLDITEVCKERNIAGEEVAEELRRSVYEATGLTCSAGVGPNRLLAKYSPMALLPHNPAERVYYAQYYYYNWETTCFLSLNDDTQVCSDINKPNGQFVLPNDRMAVMTFISSLPIRKIGGIGKVTEHVLKDVFEIKTCEDMLQKSCYLCTLFSHSSSDFFISVALGLGGTDTPQVRLRKSISNERTFSATGDEAFFHKKLVELAEMLSADMKKEGLCGRTLTLKLKTASFEVRSQAVTLQSYIWSSEDILKHASKLLKGELPISLRLIGLRMSQFNEDKDGALSDPTQKTLSNFIIPGDDYRKMVDDRMFLGSDVKDSHETCYEFRDTFGDQVSDLDLSNNSREIVESCGPEDNEHKDQVNERTPKFCEFGSPLAETNSLQLPRHFEGGSSDQMKGIQFSDDEAGSSSNKKESLMWVDDYKCSLCGVELPPSFVEERQEHSDFHLAEKLQEEESSHSYRNLMSKHRLTQKDPIVGQGRSKKKQKQSPSNGKHLSIDMFFVKRTHDL